MPRNGGLWEDLKAGAGRVLEVAQERSGRTLVRQEDLQRIAEAAADGQVYRKELEYVGWTILNHVPGGGATELKAQSRRTLALKSLNAYISDPMAGRHVDHYCGFVFGRGVPTPQARDAAVQEIIDETWQDRANKRILTSPQKLVEKGRDFCVQANVFFLYFDDGGDARVRMSLLKFDTADHYVAHPEDRFRLLYLCALEKQMKYDWGKGTEVEADPNAQPKRVYYRVIDAFASDVEDHPEDDADVPEPPAGAAVGRGKVLHLATNKTSEMRFGVPGFKRHMRWMTAYNEMLESYTDRMKAAAKLYMKANVTGGQSAVERAGLMAVRRASPMGAGVPPVEGGMQERTGLPAPGTLGVVAGNQSLNYEPFKIESGAEDVRAAAPTLRSQINGPWPDGYMGGEPGPLAGAQSLELPVLKFVEQEQELWATPFETLASRAIARAVEEGDLDEWRDPTENEAAAIAAGRYEGEVNERGRVKRDLSFDFSLPDPVKRAQGDFVSAAIQVATAVDPNADFPELSRWLFAFCLAEAFDVADPQALVDELMPLEKIREMEERKREQQDMALEGQRAELTNREELESSTGADGKQHPPGNLNGAKQKSAPPEDKTVKQAPAPRGRRARARRAAADTIRKTDADFDELVVGTADRQLAALAAVSLDDEEA